jgi:hypothetical protein
LHLKGRELYIYFPNGAGQTKLPWSKVERLLKVAGTARNWNSSQQDCWPSQKKWRRLSEVCASPDRVTHPLSLRLRKNGRDGQI